MKIQNFVDIYQKDQTKRLYRASILDYIDSVYGRVRKGKTATKDENREYERLADKYFEEDRDHYQDLLDFVSHMNGKPPGSIKVKVSAIKEFLSYNDIELSQKQLKQLNKKLPKGKTGRTAEKDIDTEMIRTLLTYADLKGRALILTLASSGMRIGEALQITLDDIDLSKSPGQITIRGEYTKSGDLRSIFVSEEAKQTLKEWLKHRESYLGSAVNRNNGLVEKGKGENKNLEDDRVFPFSDSTVRYIWENCLSKAGYYNKDKSTNRTDTRIHGLRKFFRSQLALKCPVDIVEALMGHEAYLTEAYRRHTLKQLGEYYQQGEYLITIQNPEDVKELKKKYNEFSEDLIQLQRENRELRERLDKLEEHITAYFSLKEKYPDKADKLFDEGLKK